MWEEMPRQRRGRGSTVLRASRCNCLGAQASDFDYENRVYRFVDHAYDLAIAARYRVPESLRRLSIEPYPR